MLSSNDDCLHVEALFDLAGTPQSLGSQEGADEPAHSQISIQSTSSTPNNANQENSPDATPNGNHSNAKPGRSPLSELLVHPTSSNGKSHNLRATLYVYYLVMIPLLSWRRKGKKN